MATDQPVPEVATARLVSRAFLGVALFYAQFSSITPQHESNSTWSYTREHTMKRFAIALAALFLGTSVQAATVVNFDSVASTNHQFMNSYFEKGLNFTSSSGNGFASIGSSTTLYTGSSALLNNAVNGITTMSHMSSGLMTMRNISLSELSPSGGSSTVTFTGVVSGGGTVTQSFSLDGTFGNEVFTFSSAFTDLVSLSWNQASPYHQFDNIRLVVTAVPAPASGLLILSGLGAFAALRRRKRA